MIKQERSNARTLTVAAPYGTSTITSTDGLSSTTEDARGNETTTTSDIWGRVVSVTPPTGPQVSYSYDVLDRLTLASRAGEDTTLTYDKAGRKTSMSDPDMGYWTYDYDALGNLTSQTDARNCTLTLTYDTLSRPDTKTSSGSCGVQISVDYDYDDIENGNKGLGRRTSMTDASGSTAWTYDPRGRVTGEQRMFGEIVFGATAHAF